MRKMFLAVSLTAMVAAAPAAFAQSAEVLHWWTSGGEARAVGVLQQEFANRGGTWTDMPVAGGGGDAAMTALRARVLAGNAPAAVQLKGPAIQEWFEEGVLADISAVAEAQGWADILPEAIAQHMMCEGTWCAAPVNVHRVDWIWANPQVLARAGVTRDQAIQAMGVAFYMAGAPSLTDASQVLAVFDRHAAGDGAG